MTNEYEVVAQDGVVVHRDVQTSVQQVVTRAATLDLVRSCGLAVSELTDGWLAVTR